MLRSFFVLLAFLALAPLRGAGPPPNFVLVVADDQGWTGTSVRMDPEREDSANARGVRTPALERLAREGMTFAQAYAPHSMCGPTRHSLQFGRSPAGLGLSGGQNFPNLPGTETGIANVLKRADSRYVAAHFGKWNLRLDPRELGYDDSDGLLSNSHGHSGKPDDPKWIFWLTERAGLFMDRQVADGRPFLIQLSHFAIHPAGGEARPATLKSIEQRGVASGRQALPMAMTEDLDAGLGLLLERIDKLGIADHTYVVYTSDNGGGSRGNSRRNGPLSGGKGSCLEGGIRVPLIVRGPGIEGGSHSREPVVGHDLLPTFLELAKPGAQNPAGWEGGSLAGIWKGEAGEVDRTWPYLLWHVARPEIGTHFDEPHTAIRHGRYKLLRLWSSKRTMLYDLEADLGETRDLAADQLAKVKELTEVMEQYLAEGLPEGHFERLGATSAPPRRR